MPWIQLQQFNPYEEWQYSNTAVLSTFEYFKFEWNANTPRLLNYVCSSSDTTDLFEIRKLISSSKATILLLPSTPFWTERKIGILCPKIWASALPNYKVNLYVWQ